MKSQNKIKQTAYIKEALTGEARGKKIVSNIQLCKAVGSPLFPVTFIR